jgi:hypothetical protein
VPCVKIKRNAVCVALMPTSVFWTAVVLSGNGIAVIWHWLYLWDSGLAMEEM